MSFLIKTQLNEAPINPSTQTNSPAWCLERKVPEWVIQIDTGSFQDKPCSTLPPILKVTTISVMIKDQQPSFDGHFINTCLSATLCYERGSVKTEKKKTWTPLTFHHEPTIIAFLDGFR